MRTLMTACLISLMPVVFSQEQQQDPHVLIEKQHRDYLNAFSQRDVEKIERYFGYPLFSTAHRIAVIPIDNERYKAIVTVSHRTEADDWLLTEEEIFFTKISSQILTGRTEYITTPSTN